MIPPPHDSTPELRWCFSTLGCPELGLPEVLSLARKHAIAEVELRALSDRLDLAELFTECFEQPQAMHAWMQRQQVRIAALDSSAKLIGCAAAARRELLDFARWADRLEVPGIRVFDGGAFQPRLSPADRTEALDFLQWWDEERAAHGWSVNLIVETHDALCSSDACLELAEAAEGRLHLLWDAHHTWRKGGEDPLETWSRIGGHVRHVHFKDSVGRPSARHPFTYTGLGQGEFALEALFERLRADAFAGPVSLEWERKWHPYLDPLPSALGQLDAIRAARAPQASQVSSTTSA